MPIPVEILQEGMKSFWREELQEEREKTRQEGQLDGQRRLLHHMLTRRFGELPGWAKERLESATSELISTWSDRLLSASNIDEVFA